MINAFLAGCCSDIMIGLFTGLFSGIYAGLVVARYSRFAELQNTALQTIRSIDYIQKDNVLNITGNENCNKLLLNVSCSLLALTHKGAANVVFELANDILNINQQAETGCIKIQDYERHYLAWQP